MSKRSVRGNNRMQYTLMLLDMDGRGQGRPLTLAWVSKSYPLLKVVHMFRRGIMLILEMGLGGKWLSFDGMG